MHNPIFAAWAVLSSRRGSDLTQRNAPTEARAEDTWQTESRQTELNSAPTRRIRYFLSKDPAIGKVPHCVIRMQRKALLQALLLGLGQNRRHGSPQALAAP